MQAGGGGNARGFDEGALDRQQLGLGRPDQAGDIAIPGGLPSLTFQTGELAVELGFEVIGAGQIGLGRAQLEFGFVPAGVQAGDSSRFLQHGTPVLGAGADQGTNAPLADHGGGASAGRQIGEQRLHVAGAGFLAVDPIGGSMPALDLADDLKVGLLMEGRRGDALGFLQEQRDLGDVAGGAAGRAGEDDVLHLSAAQVAGAGLAHGPAQSLHNVRFATAIRANDSRQARQDLDIRRLREALETNDAQAAKTDRQTVLRALDH